MLFGSGTQVIEYHPWLHARDSFDGINVQDLRHVLRKVHDNRNIAALARQRGPSTAAQDWCAKIACNGHCGHYVFITSRNHYADRDLAVAGTVGCIECATAVVEANFA